MIDHDIVTTQEMGWSGIKNGELLSRAQGQFDVFLTADKYLRFQQNLEQFTLAVIVFPSNREPIVMALAQRAMEMIATIHAGQIAEL